MIRRPIFIIGNPRSGTTLLRLMLTCHRNIVIPPECGFAVWLSEKFVGWCSADCDGWIDRLIPELMQCRKIETWNLQLDGLRSFLKEGQPATYPEAVGLVYEWYGISTGRSFSRWGDKNNFYLHHLSAIKLMFEDAHFVHIIRDGRDIACSFKRLKKVSHRSKYFPSIPERIEDTARQWRDNLRLVKQSFDKIGREAVVEIKFEELLLNTVDTLRTVCESIGEPLDKSMLEYHRVNRDRQLEPVEFLDWKGNTIKPPLCSAVGRFQTELNEEERGIFEGVAGDVLKALGYAI
jgi:hypothetical protein